ncbi:hypothetical protein D3C77_416460 [compost metagenome]
MCFGYFLACIQQGISKRSFYPQDFSSSYLLVAKFNLIKEKIAFQHTIISGVIAN